MFDTKRICVRRRMDDINLRKERAKVMLGCACVCEGWKKGQGRER